MVSVSVEHVAWQVQNPPAVADWYVKNLGFRIVRKNENDPARTHFVADASGKCIVEIYNNSAASVLDYGNMHFLQLHLAFGVDGDVATTRDELLKAGCSVAEDVRTTPAGDTLCMMRDPFGFAIQLCKRAKPMT
jgi:glyoxylase I family protein